MATEEKTAAERLVAGMAIILKREPKTSIDIHDDVLFAGTSDYSNADDSDSAYTEADRNELEALGWDVDEGSWCFAT